MFGSLQDFRLKRAVEPRVVFAEAADSHHEIRIIFRLFKRFAERLLIDNGHLDLHAAAFEEGGNQ